MLDRERAQNESIDHAKDNRVHADAKSKREHTGGGKSGRSQQAAYRVVDVTANGI
jgi:hypothetical protein